MVKGMGARTAGFLAIALAAGAWIPLAASQEHIPARPSSHLAAAVPDSEQLEKELQGLNWQQFKSVVTAVPKLKSDVDAYGPLGWQYVQANYKTYKWKKNIDKLDDSQKTRLGELIRRSKHDPKLAD